MSKMLCAECRGKLSVETSPEMVQAILETGEAAVKVKCDNCGAVYEVSQRLLRSERRTKARP